VRLYGKNHQIIYRNNRYAKVVEITFAFVYLLNLLYYCTFADLIILHNMEKINWQRNVTMVLEGEKFIINGLNIWDFEWQSTKEYFERKDTSYRRYPSRRINVYKIHHEDIAARFGAEDISNCVWEIYQSEYQSEYEKSS
jgi:hypothetical protein